MTEKNRRIENRNPCFLRADIIVGMNKEPIPAEAHDISERGFRLVLPETKRRLPS